MAEYTERLQLFKYNTDTDGKRTFNINESLNENWDKIDEFAEDINENYVKNDEIATNNELGLVKIGSGIYIENDGTISSHGGTWGEIDGNIEKQTDLINLVDAKFQYAPFSINNGVVSNGKNATLQMLNGDSVQINKSIITVMSSASDNNCTVTNSREQSNAYLVTNPGYYTWASSSSGAAATKTVWYFNLNEKNYIPPDSQVNCTFTTGDNDNVTISYKYIDDTTENAGGSPGLLSSPSKQVKQIILSATSKAQPSSHYVTKLFLGNFTVSASYSIFAAASLICQPCTITTADNRTKKFEYDEVFDCSNLSDGNYYVMKSYTDGSLSVISKFVMSNTEPVNSDLWLDTSQFPLTLKQYDGENWVINNDLVYIGNVTVSGGLITAANNNPYNWNGKTGSSAGMPSSKYIDLTLGSSGSKYTAPADGYFYLNKKATAQNQTVMMEGGGIATTITSYNSSADTYCYLPVGKNTNVTVTYTLGGETNYFRFIYAAGEV